MPTDTVFDPSDEVDARELQVNVVKVLGFMVRERPPMLFETCDRLIGRLEAATVDTAELITALRERRASILAEREAIKSAMERPEPPLVGWIAP